VEHCKLFTIGYNDPNRSCGYHLWLQSASWDFRSVNGHWSYLRQNGGNPCQGDVQVSVVAPHLLALFLNSNNWLLGPIHNLGYLKSVLQMYLVSHLVRTLSWALRRP
jgi:hypothetical protein